MAFPTRLQPLRRGPVLLVSLLSAALTGCAKRPPPAQPLVGNWQGTMAAGNAAIPSVWDIRANGTQSLTLTLPQGAMTTQGTWTTNQGILTERTTARIVVLGGEQKTVPLVNPMETTFPYHLTGDTLTLTQPETHRQIVLTRVAGTKGR